MEQPRDEKLNSETVKARAAAVICEVGALCGWPGPECKSREAAEALFNAGLLSSPDPRLAMAREALEKIKQHSFLDITASDAEAHEHWAREAMRARSIARATLTALEEGK